MKKIAILSGAGISVESGLSTFRGGGGLWDNYPVEQVATPEGFRANPALVLEFYNKRRKELAGIKPNRAHELVAALEKNYDVTVITQNVDDLHERAGSTRIIHLHGELLKACSSKQPQNTLYVSQLPSYEHEITIGDLAPDGSQLRPFIVWFGEPVPLIEDAVSALNDIDVFIIIGTSLNVYPAAGLLNYVPSSAQVFLVDPNDVPVHSKRNVTVLKMGASEGMEQIVNKFLNL